MKKILALALSAIVIFCLVACGGDDEATEEIYETVKVIYSDSEKTVYFSTSESQKSKVTVVDRGASEKDGDFTETDFDAKSEPINKENANYILNLNSKIFHYPNCKSVAKMKEENKEYFLGTRDEALERGFKSCGNCLP